jgi:hypothetical protein
MFVPEQNHPVILLFISKIQIAIFSLLNTIWNHNLYFLFSHRQHVPSILESLNISAAEDVELMITTLAVSNALDAIPAVLHLPMLLDLFVVYVFEKKTY